MAVVIAASAPAELAAAAPAPHLRPETGQARALVAELLDRSKTARALVERLEQSDVIVYVRHQSFAESTLDGRIGFLRSGVPSRILIVEISGERSHIQQLVTLGHELQHAVEVADEAAVVDPASMAALYARIGVRVRNEKNSVSFETARAQSASERIRRELLRPTVRTSEEQP